MLEEPGNHARSRRSILGTGLGLTAIALAGCLGDDNSNDDEMENDRDEDVNPVEFPDEQPCRVCEMITGDHPDWNAQLVNEDETRVYFCSSGCFLAYHTDPEHFDGTDAATEGAWVTGFESGDLISASNAAFVEVRDPDHVDDVMMINPIAFDDAEDAEDFIAKLNDDHDADYDPEADIIRLEDFDRDLAEFYRSQFFDGEESGH